MIRLMLLRGLLVALPFVAWYVYASVLRRTGREPPRAPYAWLFLGGMALMASSLFATALLGDEHTDDVYVPAEVREDGRVLPPRYETAREKPVDRPDS